MTYQVGDKLCLKTVGEMRENRFGRNFIMVTDDQSQYPVHNILKCQYEDFPEFLHVKVTEVDVYGRPSFIQDFPAVFAHHYHKGERKIVDITSTGVDDDKRYYLVEDDFAEHRFYTDKEYPIGESILIEIIGFTKKGFLYFKEVTNDPDSVSTSIASTPSPRARQTRIILGPENIELERKSSIVFTAANSEPNIQDQMIVICKVLAAFMNTEGGCLVIGVTDKDDVVKGIESDYPYLNTDPDYTDRTYHQNEDGYRLKILDVVNYRCGSLAGSMLRFDFKEKEGKRYLKINVTKAECPVWVREGGKGAVLYIRQDGRCKAIYGNEITRHITSQMHETMKNTLTFEEYFEKFEERLKKLINQREHKEDIELPTPPVRDVQYWLMWNNNGTWKKLNAPDQSASLQIPVYKSDKKNQRIMQCYADAKIVTRDVTQMVPQKVHNNEEQRSMNDE